VRPRAGEHGLLRAAWLGSPALTLAVRYQIFVVSGSEVPPCRL
jgi:hypothetical protein